VKSLPGGFIPHTSDRLFRLESSGSTMGAPVIRAGDLVRILMGCYQIVQYIRAYSRRDLYGSSETYFCLFGQLIFFGDDYLLLLKG